MFAILAIPLLIFTFAIVDPQNHENSYQSQYQEGRSYQNDNGDLYNDDYSQYE